LRGYAKSGVVEEIRKAGGAIFAVTSEPHSLATEAEQTWDFGFPSIGDPHHEILGACRERGWIDLFVNEQYDLLKTRSWTAHPKGYFQPGVLALTGEGRVLYRWRCRPTRKNVGGAVERPTPEHAWAETLSRLDTAVAEPPLDLTPEMDTKPPSWPFFVLLLLAHGWFLRPEPFPLGREGEEPAGNPRAMFPRIFGFFALWMAAFVFLPTVVAALALGGWAAFITPKLITAHQEFQNIPEGEPDAV
jgi:hypothetical protein